MAGVRPQLPPKFTALSTRVILACKDHPQVLYTYSVLEALAWGKESRSLEFDGQWFFEQFGVPLPTLLRHLKVLSKQPIRAVLVYRSAGARFRTISLTLANVDPIAPNGIKNDTVSKMIIPVVVNNTELIKDSLTTIGIKNDTVSNLIPGEPEPTQPAKPNIFALYEQNFGALTPHLADELREAEKDYPPEWIREAFEISVGNNKRFWAYAYGILKRWKEAGQMTRRENTDDSHSPSSNQYRAPGQNSQQRTPPSSGDLAAAARVLQMQDL